MEWEQLTQEEKDYILYMQQYDMSKTKTWKART